ncbi:MAG: chemotaxis protein CheW [Treponema sp.]|jgi:purine-binding chemotaxis protein CheW|nr:chemotaxis protein CheW [Treponema sp.]
MEKFLIFTIQGRRYGLPSKLINEVAVVEKVFPLPLVPDYIKGIINRYSTPYALIDAGLLLLKTPSTEARKAVVLKETVEKLALLIDDVTDIADVEDEELLKVEQEAGDGGAPEFIESSFDWQGEAALCLNMGELIRFLKEADLSAGESGGR